jgi:predicted nucleic acid-binding protein
METYLLDTNIISDLANSESDSHPACMAHLQAAVRAGDRILLPVTGIAEIEFGLQIGGRPESVQANEIRKFLSGYQHIDFDDNSIEPYAPIRAKLFELYGNRKGKRKSFKEKTTGELKDRVTGEELGIDERDLLIVSTAVQYNSVFVTDDSNEGMRRIRGAADLLAGQGWPTQLRVDNWRRTV